MIWLLFCPYLFIYDSDIVTTARPITASVTLSATCYLTQNTLSNAAGINSKRDNNDDEFNY